jgi:F-type H+-transporting ATPase subunit epsilon
LADGKKELEARVLTPEGEIFHGEVVQLSTRTVVGEIGILADHVPLLARLVPCELRLHLSEGEVQRYAQAEGWLEVFGNRAMVLIGEAIPPERLDAEELRQRVSSDEQRIKEADEGSAARERAERDLARAQAFLEVAGKQ